MSDLWTTVVAVAGVVGTLAGVIITNRANAATARTALEETHRKEQRNAALNAATALLAAIADHRTAMWKRQLAVVTSEDPQRCRETRDASHDTRRAITQPLLAVEILLPSVAAQARAAAQATYAMRDAVDQDMLDAARAAAHAAAEALTQAVTAALTAEGTIDLSA